jgi:hypothetical protein
MMSPGNTPIKRQSSSGPVLQSLRYLGMLPMNCSLKLKTGGVDAVAPNISARTYGKRCHTGVHFPSGCGR